MRNTVAILLALSSCLLNCFGQSLGNAGTINGTVIDPSGGVVAKAEVSVRNVVTGYTQSVVSGPDGSFRLVNLPPNPYHLEVKASGFSVFSQDVDIRNAIPVQVKAALALAGASEAVTVTGPQKRLKMILLLTSTWIEV
jgi:hypothetical protein